MISKKASIIAYIFTAIGFFDISLAEPGRAGQNRLQFQYIGKCVELYQSVYLQLLINFLCYKPYFISLLNIKLR